MKQPRVWLVVLFTTVLASQPSGREQAGKLPDGSWLLPTGWRIQPVGMQVPLDTLPMSSALSRDGKYLLVLNGGYHPPAISVIATADMKEAARVPVPDGWLGLTFSPDGTRVYVGGGSKFAVFEFSFSSYGQLKPTRTIEIAPGVKPGETDFIGDVAVSPDGKTVYAADLYHDSVAVVDLQSARVTGHFKTGRRPYRIVLLPDGKTYFVSSWADGTVYWHDARTGSEITRLRLGPHTTDMVLSDRKNSATSKDWPYRLFVAASNTNIVYVVGVSSSNTAQVLETLNIGMTARQPAGMTPSGLALSADQTRLFVACSDANVVAVADISDERSRLEGFVPSGWYPTGARALPDGRLVILNGRGFSLSAVNALNDETLDTYTKSALSLSPYRDTQLDQESLEGNSVLYSRPGQPSPIEHVVYIIKGNQTYDQVFGKLGKGNGEAALARFDESAAPNHYKLAREFVLFDNFYANADVRAEGQNWTTAGIAPDYTQRLWPNQYGHRSAYNRFEGGEPANTPPAGYLWSNALIAGLSVRNYGEFVENKKPAGGDGIQVDRVNDPSLLAITNRRYRGFDPGYPDVERARVFLSDLKEFEQSGTMPRLMIVSLGNDRAMAGMADNDSALGQIVEGVSKSRFWAKTAIFAVESDTAIESETTIESETPIESETSDGRDHVDPHRSVMLAISPYTHRGIVDSAMYNQSSILRTIELILGLRPMTQFDAAARPLTAAFTATPSAAAYAAEKPR